MKLLQIPGRVLVPLILLVSMLGVYAFRQNPWDALFCLGFGALAIVLRWGGFELAPMILGFILGPLIEKYFRQGMGLEDGSLLYFVSTPISGGLWAIVLIALVARFVTVRRARRAAAAQRQDVPVA